MTDTTPPIYSDGQTTIYQVQIPVAMPMRMPDAAEVAKLGPAPAYAAPFGATTAPWIRVDDVQTTVRFTITNLDDQKHAVELLLDAWNPWVKYKPGIQIISDEVTLPDLSTYDRYYVLDPKARLVGTLTPDDTREMAIDLATVMNIQNTVTDPLANLNALFNHTMDLQNRSTGSDPLIQPYIPASQDVAAIIGFDLGLRSLDPMNVAVEVTIDVQDVTGKKVMPFGQAPNADNQPMAPPGGVLAPPKAPVMM